MQEEVLLKECCRRVVAKFGNPDVDNWKSEDYIALSKSLFESTGISISTDTLKRLFGKKKSAAGEYITPQIATKNAIAQYVGFESWAAFKIEYVKSQASSAQENVPNRKTQYNRTFPAIVVASVILLLSVWFAIFYIKSTEQSINVHFKASNNKGKIPLLVEYGFKLPPDADTSFFIDLGYKDRLFHDPGKNILKINSGQSTAFESYQFPDWHKAKIYRGKQVLDSTTVYATYDKWMGLAGFYMNPLAEINYVIASDKMYFDPQYMKEMDFLPTKHYLTEFRYFNELNADGDSCVLSSMLQNSSSTGGKSCFDVWLELICENGMISIQFVEPGCQKYTNIVVSEHYLDGRYNDLKVFGKTFEVEREVKIATEKGLLKAFLEGNLIFEKKYSKKLGKVKGIKTRFKGCGSMRKTVLNGRQIQNSGSL